jgi:alpha/beta superfamily hydrolase
MAAHIQFDSDGLRIEGRFYRGRLGFGAVISHPHPLYGGDMNNPVVGAVAAAYQSVGASWLVFNFRGVGGSQGAFDDGVGERRDVAAAVAFLRGTGVSDLHLAGYSFGAWVNAHSGALAAQDDSQIMVSPPVALLDFTALEAVPALKLVITGDRDPFAPPKTIAAGLARWAPDAELAIVPNGDHFFSGQLADLEQTVRGYLDSCKKRR